MPENVPYAREVLNAFPTTPTPATDYFIRQPDGRIEHWISDLAAPHTLRPVSFNVAVTGAPPPTSVTRTGSLTSTQTYGSLASARQRFRPTVNIPVTGVQVDQLTVSGNAAVAFHDLTTGTWVAAAAASQVGAGITATLSVLLLAGHEYFLHVGTLGSGVNGTDYTGFVSGVTLSSGHAWTGLTLTAPPSVFESATPVTAGAQLAFQLLTGDMAGFDPSGVTHRAQSPATVAYDPVTRTYTHGVLLDLSAAGEPITDALPFGADTGGGNPAQVAYKATFTVLKAGQLTSVRQAWRNLGGLRVLVNNVAVQEFTGLTGAHDVTTHHTFPLASPPDLQVGDTVAFEVLSKATAGFDVLTMGRIATPIINPGTLDTTGGSFRWTNTLADGWICEFTLEGDGFITGVLPEARVGGLADVKARVTALEGRTNWTLEAVQDAVGAMLPQGTYNDDAGTVSFTFATPRTDEEIQDVVAALIQAGANVTKTYDDAGNVLTISATGGGGTGLPAGGTTGQVLTKLSATDGDAGWQTPATGSGGGGATLTRTTAGTGSNAAITSYTVSPAAHSTYTDSGGELTNSVLPAAGAAYTDPTWVGWQNTNVTVNLDFGAALTPGSLAAYTFGGGTGSIYSPSNITVFNSTDNVNWTQVSTTDYATDGGSGWQVAPAPGTARYWRMVFTRRTTSSWIFIGEVKAQPTAKVTGLPAGYMLRSSERQSGVNEVLLTLMPTRVDVVNSEGMVKASAWMTGGDTWTYTN